MALSIYDVLYHAQNDKYPQIIKGPGLIQGITPVVDQEGTEAFGFYRPSISGAIAPSGIPEGEVAYVSKADLENYSQRVFGQELPQVIDSHRVTTQYGESQIQSPSATKGADPRYSRVKSGGIDENHGWKIHADLVQDQDYDQAMASIGRSSDHSIADKSVAEAFDKRLRNLGMETDDFLQHFKRLGTDPRDGNVKFINPQDLATSMEVFDRHSVTYKMTALTYGEGRHITAYPQSIVNRDKLITDMENSLGQRLVDQNDPAYRSRLGPEVGVKNHPLSRGVSGRFTTDYLEVDPNTGKVDFSLSSTGNPAPEEYKISGKISPEDIEIINRVNAEMPEMAELLHGPNGYVSPYRTIEQIAQDRASGAINVSHTIESSILDANSPHGLAFAPVGGVVHNPQRNPLPPINGRGQVSAPGTPPPTSAPSVATAPPAVAKSAGSAASAEVDMLGVAKRLIPDIETGMPEDVAKAFSEGRIKTIFRTAESLPLEELTSGSESRISGAVNPGSTYFLDEEGRIARYGRGGKGWSDARVSSELYAAGSSGKSSFLDRAVFGKTALQELDTKSGKAPSEAVDDFIKQGGFTEPTLGGTLTEFDNDFSRKHKGHAVSDIYRSTGEVEFVGQLTEGESVGGRVRPKVVKTNIENISIEKNSRGNITPRLVEASVAPTPTSTVTPEIKTIGAENLTEAGKARANAVGRADKVLSAMDDDELIEYLKKSQDFLAEQQKIDPDGKKFKPQAEYRLKSVEKELRDRGIHPDDAAPSVAKTSATKKGPIDIGKPVDDIRTSPTARGTDAASGGSVTPSGTPHNVATTQNLTTKNTNPTTTPPKAQAKINSQTTASGTNIATNRPAGPGNTQKAKGLLDNGLKTAQDLAGGNARLMGIAGIAGLLGVGVASSRSRTKQNPPPDRGTYMDRSRQDLDY